MGLFKNKETVELEKAAKRVERELADARRTGSAAWVRDRESNLAYVQGELKTAKAKDR
ncbi:hypothetical protein ABZU75_23405 [Streptosporangium sp. NPDC005286]|uniref:hypothetical protein n=1 Tax=Streptosporangium sp. NPDC005286 TaxID=3154463 RepID=UPI0033B3BD7A